MPFPDIRQNADDQKVTKKRKRKTENNSKQDKTLNTLESVLSKEALEQERKARDALRKKTRRQAMTAEEREAFRARENERKRKQRREEWFDKQRALDALKKREKRAAMSSEQKAAFKKKDAERKRRARQRLALEKYAAKNNDNTINNNSNSNNNNKNNNNGDDNNTSETQKSRRYVRRKVKDQPPPSESNMEIKCEIPVELSNEFVELSADNTPSEPLLEDSEPIPIELQELLEDYDLPAYDIDISVNTNHIILPTTHAEREAYSRDTLECIFNTTFGNYSNYIKNNDLHSKSDEPFNVPTLSELSALALDAYNQRKTVCSQPTFNEQNLQSTSPLQFTQQTRPDVQPRIPTSSTFATNPWSDLPLCSSINGDESCFSSTSFRSKISQEESWVSMLPKEPLNYLSWFTEDSNKTDCSENKISEQLKSTCTEWSIDEPESDITLQIFENSDENVIHSEDIIGMFTALSPLPTTPIEAPTTPTTTIAPQPQAKYPQLKRLTVRIKRTKITEISQSLSSSSSSVHQTETEEFQPALRKSQPWEKPGPLSRKRLLYKALHSNSLLSAEQNEQGLGRSAEIQVSSSIQQQAEMNNESETSAPNEPNVTDISKQITETTDLEHLLPLKEGNTCAYDKESVELNATSSEPTHMTNETSTTTTTTAPDVHTKNSAAIDEEETYVMRSEIDVTEPSGTTETEHCTNVISLTAENSTCNNNEESAAELDQMEINDSSGTAELSTRFNERQELVQMATKSTPLNETSPELGPMTIETAVLELICTNSCIVINGKGTCENDDNEFQETITSIVDQNKMKSVTSQEINENTVKETSDDSCKKIEVTKEMNLRINSPTLYEEIPTCAKRKESFEFKVQDEPEVSTVKQKKYSSSFSKDNTISSMYKETKKVKARSKHSSKKNESTVSSSKTKRESIVSSTGKREKHAIARESESSTKSSHKSKRKSGSSSSSSSHKTRRQSQTAASLEAEQHQKVEKAPTSLKHSLTLPSSPPESAVEQTISDLILLEAPEQHSAEEKQQPTLTGEEFHNKQELCNGSKELQKLHPELDIKASLQHCGDLGDLIPITDSDLSDIIVVGLQKLQFSDGQDIMNFL